MTGRGESVINCREQLNTLLRSPSFQKSETLSRLLEYLGERSLVGEADELKEQAVGVAALGKRSGYDPQQDSSVRVHVNRLRHKLVEYYATEGADDPVELSIPKGHFKVVYRARATAESLARTTSGELTWRRRAIALGTLAILLAGLAIYWRTMPPQGRQEAMAATNGDEGAFWAPYLPGERPILICLGTPLFAWIDGHYYRPGGVLNDPSAVPESQEVARVARILDTDKIAPVFRFAATGEAIGAFNLGKLLTGLGIDAGIRKSSELTWDELEDADLIFVGAPKFNRQLRYALPEGNFRIVGDTVENTSPRAGEAPVYRRRLSDDGLFPVEDYALIWRVPGLHGRGYMTVFASNDAFGSRAAIEFCTSPQYLAQLLEQLRDATGRIPDYFEVVVRAELERGHPIRVSYVTHHVIAPEVSRAGNASPRM